MGSDKPKVTIIEFFDYNCGYCKKSLDAITELLRSEYDLKVSFRDYPILAPSSRTAAKAALAAKLQGKYFALHSALMNMQGNLNDEKIYEAASNLKIDVIVKKLEHIKPVNGRLELVGKTKDNSIIILDYAHTPDALKNLLKTLRGLTKGRLLLVFGAGGERDKDKGNPWEPLHINIVI